MIQKIRLQQYRSYRDASFAFSPGVNVIVGPNASGKTNLLEAVQVLSQGKSFRAKDSELVRGDCEWARLDGETDGGERTVKLTSGPPPQKSITIDGVVLTRLQHARRLPLVLFEPDHLLLFGGSPELRRSFMDDLIEQTVAGFGSLRSQYKRALTQRNALLKKNPPNISEHIFVWNLRLSELGGRIAQERAKLLGLIAGRLGHLYSSLAGTQHELAIEYVSGFGLGSYESALLHKLESSVELDVLRGFTAYGPHRDDFRASIDGKLAQDTASRGEIRTLVLALKIVELQMIEMTCGKPPMLLLDDVFSELDAKRRQALTRFVKTHQTFITTTDADVVGADFVRHKTLRAGEA